MHLTVYNLVGLLVEEDMMVNASLTENLEIRCPDLVSLWRIALRGRVTNTERFTGGD